MNDPQHDHTERRLQDYFARVARTAQPLRPNVWPQIAARLGEADHAAQPDAALPDTPFHDTSTGTAHQPLLKGSTAMQPDTVARSPRNRRPFVSIAAVVVVALVIASAMLFNGIFHSHHGVQNPVAAHPTPTATATTTSKPVGSVTDHGITLTVDAIYATPLGTDMHMTTRPHHMPDGGAPVVVSDTLGHSFVCDDSAVSSGDAETYGTIWTEIERCPAFPLSEYGHPLTLTVKVACMGTDGYPQTDVCGNWQITTTVFAVAPSATITDILPVTRNGITIQPTIAILTQGATPDPYVPSGIIAFLHIDGRASQHLLCGTLFDLTTNYHAVLSHATLTLPGGSAQLPFYDPVSIAHAESCPNASGQSPSNNATNFIDRQLVWAAPLATVPDQMTLTISQLNVAVGPQWTMIDIPGPWTWTIHTH